MDQNLSSEQLREIIEALERGSKIEAVKAYREATGQSLAESVKAIEAIPYTPAAPAKPAREVLSPREAAPSGLTPEKRAAVMGAIRRKQKIEAIKIYREATGLGLAESKEAVEALEQWRGAAEGGSTFEERTPLPHWDPFAEKKKGCFGMIALLVGGALTWATFAL
jgi:ribosomal protein L7/L12